MIVVCDLVYSGCIFGHNACMQADMALAILRKHEPELRSLGLEAASIFGSTARGEAGPRSDVDIVVRLKLAEREGGFAVLDRLDRIKVRIAELLSCPVDVVIEPQGYTRLRGEIDEDRLVAF